LDYKEGRFAKGKVKRVLMACAP